MFIQAADTLNTPEGERSSARASRRTHQPVRRNSRLIGKDDRLFWRPMKRAEIAQIVLAARKFDLANRRAGERNGPLGHVAIEVLELFANLVSFKTGQLDPSLEYLCRKLARSKDAVHRALKALRAHGFLDWLRRYAPTENEGRGPQVKQISNAYRLSLPRKAMQWLGAWGRSVPLPDDFTHATDARSAEMDAYEATLSPEAYAMHRIEDDGLAVALAGLARAMASRKERESAEQAESLTRI
jgi:hypothetical protein